MLIKLKEMKMSRINLLDNFFDKYISDIIYFTVNALQEKGHPQYNKGNILYIHQRWCIILYKKNLPLRNALLNQHNSNPLLELALPNRKSPQFLLWLPDLYLLHQFF